MEIQPRYESDPVIVIDGSIDDIRAPFLRQRRRLAATLHELSDEEWAGPSRCKGWSSKDVIAHLASTDKFWSFSLSAAVAGSPTKVLVGFDPKATPAMLVEAARTIGPTDVLADYVAGVHELCRVVEALSDADWELMGEAPPGHLSVRSVVHHALWDSWVHERDVMVPLGRVVVEEPDEVAASLRYAVALSPTFALMAEPSLEGRLVLEVTDPDVRLVAEIGPSIRVRAGGDADGPTAIRGAAADVVEQLSIRRPFDQDVPADQRWMVGGLAEVFESDR